MVSQQIERLSAFKDLYIGQRAFVLGSGPSLRDEADALLYLEHEQTIVCNEVAYWDGLPFTPKFYALGEAQGYDGPWDVPWAIPKFALSHVPISWPDWIWIPMVEERISGHGMVGLDHELAPLRTGYTVVLDIVQFACWMGFDEIYLLGAEQTRSGYAHDEDGDRGRVFRVDRFYNLHMERLQRNLARMAEEMGLQGRQLVDCTQGGFFNGTGAERDWPVPHKAVLPFKPLAEVVGSEILSHR